MIENTFIPFQPNILKNQPYQEPLINLLLACESVIKAISPRGPCPCLCYGWGNVLFGRSSWNDSKYELQNHRTEISSWWFPLLLHKTHMWLWVSHCNVGGFFYFFVKLEVKQPFINVAGTYFQSIVKFKANYKTRGAEISTFKKSSNCTPNGPSCILGKVDR